MNGNKPNEELIEKFERARIADREATISAYLPATDDPQYLSTLIELVLIALEFDWKESSAESETMSKLKPFVDAYPELNEPATIRHLVRQEMEIRQEFADPPDIVEYCRLFPSVIELDTEHSGTRRATNSADYNVRVGDQIGDYKLLQLLGEGGFGQVFLAEQKVPVKRQVALKIIKAGMDTREVIARFEAERQALAMMDHENVAKVFDGGATDKGRPYFVMELIKGVPITEYCDTNRLSVGQRLELFVSVCHAVQHAHRKGIIHRDIKPSNVMIALYDGKPVPKVIDFGVAKAIKEQLTEKTMFTRYGQIMGTPQYMSPEQAELNQLDIDTRSDVYSLGILLYELLTGSTPIELESLRSVAFDQMLRMIKEVDPPKPSTRVSESQEGLAQISAQRQTEPEKLGRFVKGELDWIVMKSIEKDRNRRYESVKEFGQDIERFLNREVVSASPPSVRYRVGKYVQKHKVLISTVAAFVLVLLSATIVSATMAVIATQQKQKAEEAEEETAVALKETSDAKAAVEEALQASDMSLERAEGLLDFMLEAFRLPSPEYEGRNLKAVQILRWAVKELPKRFDQDPFSKSQLLWALAQTYKNLGLPNEALPLAEQAYQIDQEIFEEGDSMLLDSTNDLADIYMADGKGREAFELIKETTKETQRLYGDADERTIDSMNQLAMAYMEISQPKEAMRILTQAEKFSQPLLDDKPELGLTLLHNIASTHADLGNVQQALRIQQDCVEQSLKQLGEDSLSTISAMASLATFLENAGKIKLAKQQYERTLEKMNEKLGGDHPDTLLVITNLSILYNDMERYDQAIEFQQQSLEKLKSRLDPDHPQVLTLMSNLAASHAQNGNSKKAMELFDLTIQLMKKKLGEHHPDTLETQGNLAWLYGELGQFKKSLSLTKIVFEKKREELGTDHPSTLTSMSNLANAYADAGDHQQAIRHAENVVEAMRTKLGEDHPDTLTTLSNLAQRYLKIDRRKDYERVQKDLINLQTEHLGGDDDETLTSILDLAIYHDRFGSLEQSRALYDQYRSGELKNGSKPETFSLVFAAYRAARCSIELDEIDDAAKRLDEVEKWLANSKKRYLPHDVKSLRGAIQFHRENYPEAEADLLAGYEGLKKNRRSIPSSQKGILKQAAQRLVNLYEHLGKKKEADRWRKKATSKISPPAR